MVRYGIVTIDNVKGKVLEVTAYIYDEDKSKRIKGSPDPIDTTATQVKHTFKFDNDDLPTRCRTRNTMDCLYRIQKWKR